MMRWLVTGAGGMLAHDLLDALADQDVSALRRQDLDITDPQAVRAAVAGHHVVVNCAAWSAVDDAETHEREAFAVNATGAANIARACERQGARMVHISTDYVFGGDMPDPRRPYAVDDPVSPRTAYGRSKVAGEWAVRSELPDAHWILRTAWLYGAQGRSFVRTMAGLARAGESPGVVDDQWGQPTWTHYVARRIVDVVRFQVSPGTYHATASDSASWYELATAVYELLGQDPGLVRPTTSRAYARPAPRPLWSVLDDGLWRGVGLDALPPWRDQLRMAVASGVADGSSAQRGSRHPVDGAPDLS
jgi:dTDP-4-dehydrorhamnose reductase